MGTAACAGKSERCGGMRRFYGALSGVWSARGIGYSGSSVSWVVFMILSAYWVSRSALWLRGQVRFMKLKESLPVRPVRRTPPVHLSAALGGLLARNYDERVALVESTRTIAEVLITDPDVPLGCVRDFRYRMALARAWSAACGWLQAFESLAEEDRGMLERLGYTTATFRQRHAWLDQVVRRTVRAPALEPFGVDAVQASRQGVDAMIGELERLEQMLVSTAASPYRS
jgi:hypothetical protein